MNDYIRKAVDLADNFSVHGRHNYRIQEPDQYPIFAIRKDPPNWFLDALAAQLVRQVDTLPHMEVLIEPTCSILRDDRRCDGYQVGFANTEGPDRTMNTIKAIVDSKVLQ